MKVTDVRRKLIGFAYFLSIIPEKYVKKERHFYKSDL